MNLSPLTDPNSPQNLFLFDYTKATPQALSDAIATALERAKTALDELDALVADNPQTALAGIHAFGDKTYHISRLFDVLSHLNAVMSDDATRTLYETTLADLTNFFTQVGQSLPLYRLYKLAYDKFDHLVSNNQTAPQKRALALAIQGFELSGVALDDTKKADFAALTARLSKLSSQFANNVLDSSQSFAYPLHQEELAGLTTTGLALLKSAGDRYQAAHPDQHLPTDYVATLDIPMYLAIMQYADNRALRQRLYNAYNARASDQFSELFDHQGDFDNAPIISEILSLRSQQAKLLGFDDFSGVSLAPKMAADKTEVKAFLDNLAKHATPFARADMDELIAIGKTVGIDDIKPWDIAYLSEKIRLAKYALDSEALRPYFALPRVLDGLFEIIQTLFGVSLVAPAKPVSVWHEDVLFFEVRDSDDTLIGGIYLDLYARTGKRGGAWLSGYQARHNFEMLYLPVGYIVGNFTPPTDGKPALLTFDEVTTLFHEFGHALHHLLSQIDVQGVSGIDSVEWDAVELPSQFLENFAYTPEGIAKLSEHIDTKEPLPQAMLDAILRAKNFQSGMQTLRQLEFALFDLLIHSDDACDYTKSLQILKDIQQTISVLPPPDTYRFANAFLHIFAGGYACGYYSYKWAELLSADAFGQFEETGIFNPATGRAFRQEILATAGSRPATENFVAFRGRQATLDALLRHSGFVEGVS